MLPGPICSTICTDRTTGRVGRDRSRAAGRPIGAYRRFTSEIHNAEYFNLIMGNS